MTDASVALSPAAPSAGAARWPVVVGVVLAGVLEVLDTTIVNVALQHIKGAFGVTDDQSQWILTSYIVASVGVMPLTGLLTRRFGRRRLITTAIVGFAIFSALCGISQSIGQMVAFRIGQGLFGAFLIPLSQSILFDAFPREKRGQAMALFGLGVVVAPVLGPTLGGILTENFSWRAVFYVNIPVAALALLLISGELKREEVRSVHIDWVGLALMVTAIGALQFMLDQGETRDWFGSKMIQVAAITAVVAGVVFVARGWGLRSNVIDLGLFRDRSFTGANIAMFGFAMGLYGSVTLVPQFVQGLLGYSVVEAGLQFVPRGLAAAVSMIVTGRVLIHWFDGRLLVATGLILIGTGNLGFVGLDTQADFWSIALPGAISGLGMGLFFVPLSVLAFQSIGPEKQDEATGLYSVTRNLGSSVGIAIVGWQLAAREQVHWTTLAGHVTATGDLAALYLAPLGLDPATPEGAEVIAKALEAQAKMLAFGDAYLLTGIAAFAALPFLLLVRRPTHSGGAALAH